jgi:hypothetical protein
MQMGGMFTVVKVRHDVKAGDYRDPGWYRAPAGTVASRVSDDPDFGTPVRQGSSPSPPPAGDRDEASGSEQHEEPHHENHH